MKTVGQLLRQARLKKGKSLVQVAKETKIPRSTLEAIENDDWCCLPASPFIKGFIRNYAQAVALDPQKALAISRNTFPETGERSGWVRCIFHTTQVNNISWTIG